MYALKRLIHVLKKWQYRLHNDHQTENKTFQIQWSLTYHGGYIPVIPVIGENPWSSGTIFILLFIYILGLYKPFPLSYY